MPGTPPINRLKLLKAILDAQASPICQHNMIVQQIEGRLDMHATRRCETGCLLVALLDQMQQMHPVLLHLLWPQLFDFVNSLQEGLCQPGTCKQHIVELCNTSKRSIEFLHGLKKF